MNAYTLRAGAVALALASAPAALAQQGPTLTLQQAVAQARAANPEHLQTANDIRTARAATRQARLNLFPTASASSSFGYTASGEARYAGTQTTENPSTYESSYSLGVSYQLSGAKLYEPRTARAQERATAQRIAGADANLVGLVVQQYLSVLQAQEQVGAAEREVARTAEHQRLAQARLDVGAGTPLDLRKAEVQKGQADVTLVQRRAAYETERLRLGQIMGALLPEGTQLTDKFEVFQPSWRADSLVALALQNNPTLLSARANAAAAQTQVSAARSAYLPTLSFQAGISGYAQRLGNEDGLVAAQIAGAQAGFAACQRNNALNALIGAGATNCGPDPSQPAVQDAIASAFRDQNGRYPFSFNRQPLSAQLTVSLPLWDGDQRRRQVETARVQSEDAKLATRQQELKLAADIAGAVLTLNTSYETARLQEQVARNAAEELRLAQERFRFGAANSIDVIDAQTSLSQAEQSRIDAVYVFHKSLAALEALVGQPLR
jgi:outer membrane protein